MSVFTREEIHLWVLLGENPIPAISQAKVLKESGEPITIDEARISIDPRFGPHPDPLEGAKLINGDAAPESKPDALQLVAGKVAAWLSANNPAKVPEILSKLEALGK